MFQEIAVLISFQEFEVKKTLFSRTVRFAIREYLYTYNTLPKEKITFILEHLFIQGAPHFTSKNMFLWVLNFL